MIRAEVFPGVGVDPGILFFKFIRAAGLFDNDRELYPDIDAFFEIVRMKTFQAINNLHDFFRTLERHYLAYNQILAVFKRDEPGKANGQMVEKPLAVCRSDGKGFSL